ncbi:hypothetical protein ABIF21_008214 [Bradyrhizobium elkanii]
MARHQHGVADHGGAVGDPLQGRQIVIAERRVIDEHLDHGRHQQHVGDALLLHGGRDAVRRKALDHDVGAAGQQHRIHRRAIGEVEHRRRVQIDRAARPQAFAERVERIGHQIAMAQHHALGAAGGAAGVEDAGEIVTAAHGIGHRCAARDQRLVILHAGRRLALVGIDQLQAGDGACQRRADRRKRLVDEQDRCAAVAQRVLVLQRRPADVERHDHGAGPADGEVELEIAVGVERQDRDAVAVQRAEGADRGGKAGDAVADLAPVAPPLTADDCEPVWIDLQRAPQSVRDVHSSPPLMRFPCEAVCPPSL